MDLRDKAHNPVPFEPIDDNANEYELTNQFAEYLNCFVNQRGHVQPAPGANKLKEVSYVLDSGESIVNIFYWNAVNKRVFLTDRGRFFEFYPTSSATYGCSLLFNLMDFVGNNQAAITPSGLFLTPSAISPVASGQKWTKPGLSANGKYQTCGETSAGGGKIWRSADYGATWAEIATAPSGKSWLAVAVSSTGQYQTAIISGGADKIWRSIDYGVTFAEVAGSSALMYIGIAMSADGKYQTATVNAGKIWISTNYGFNWTDVATVQSWWGIAMSASGQYQTATDLAGLIWDSVNYGATWANTAAIVDPLRVGMSSDAKYRTVVTDGGKIWISSDYGVSWTDVASALDWYDVTVGNSGRMQAANLTAGAVGKVWVSVDYGATWTEIGANDAWYGVGISGDSQHLTMTDSNGLIYIRESIDLSVDGYLIMGLGRTTAATVPYHCVNSLVDEGGFLCIIDEATSTETNIEYPAAGLTALSTCSNPINDHIYVSFDDGTIYEYSYLSLNIWTLLADLSATYDSIPFILNSIWANFDANGEIYFVGYKTGAIPEIGYIPLTAPYTPVTIGDIYGMAADDLIYSICIFPHPDRVALANMDLKILVGLLDGYVTEVWWNSAAWVQSTNSSIYASGVTVNTITWNDNYVVFGVSSGKIYEAYVGTDGYFDAMPILIVDNTFSTSISKVFKRVIVGIGYYYICAEDGIYSKRGTNKAKRIVFDDITEADWDFSVMDLDTWDIPVALPTKYGMISANRGNTNGSLYCMTSKLDTILEGTDHVNNHNVEVVETGNAKIDPASVAEIAAPFLMINFAGKLTYYKHNFTAGRVLYYWDTATLTWATTPLPPFSSIAYTNDCILGAVEGTDEFDWTIPLEIMHFLETSFNSADHSASPIIKMLAGWNKVFMLSAQDCEVWAFTPAAAYTDLFRRIQIIQQGTQSPYSMIKLDNAVAWLNSDRQWVQTDGNQVSIVPNTFAKSYFADTDISDISISQIKIRDTKLAFVQSDVLGTLVSDLSTGYVYPWDCYEVEKAIFDPPSGKCFGILSPKGYASDRGIYELNFSLTQINIQRTQLIMGIVTPILIDINPSLTLGWLAHKSTNGKIAWCVRLGLIAPKVTIAAKASRVDGTLVLSWRNAIDGTWYSRNLKYALDGEFILEVPGLGHYPCRRQYRLTWTSGAVIIMSIEEFFQECLK